MKTLQRFKLEISTLPTILVIAVFPFILNFYEFDNNLSSYAWMAEDGTSIDLFLHGKMVFFEVLIAIAFIIFIFIAFYKKSYINIPKPFYFLLAYAVCTLLSTVLSEYSAFGFSGIYEQFENVWCLLGYVFFVFYVYQTVREQKQIDMIIYVLLIASFVMGLIGVSQFLGADIIMTDFAKNLYMPSKFAEIELALAFGKGTVYLTLYNPDYVGLYTVLIYPIMAALICAHKKKSVRILAFINILLQLISTIGADVTAAYIGIFIAVLIFISFYSRIILNSKKQLLTTIAVMLCSCIIISCIFQVHKKLQFHWADQIAASMADEAETSSTTTEEIAASENLDLQEYPLTFILETDEYVEFCYNDIIFRETMRFDDTSVILDFTDQNGNAIAYEYDETTMQYTLTEPGLEGITSITANLIDKYIGFITTIEEKSWAFTFANKDGVLSYYTFNQLGHLDKNINSESAIFTNHYQLFNGRGYIWAKTIPLLKKHILLGSGADSFTLIFPQSDYLSAYKGGYENMIISKPHCMYLQIAVQTGVLSLLMLSLFFIWYMIQCKKLYWKKISFSLNEALAVGILTGTIGFLVISLANDSTICVTPIFAVLLGLGIALNRINKVSCAE